MASLHSTPIDLSSEKFTEWDKGVFTSELIRHSLFPSDGSKAIRPLSTGTYVGTKHAISAMYQRIIERNRSFFDVADFESSIPQNFSVAEKKDLFTFQKPGSDKFPPHLDHIPPNQQVPLTQIFDVLRLADTASLLVRILPERVVDFIHGDPDRGNTIAQIEDRNRELLKEHRDIYQLPNIGDRSDWYSDAVFAQQQFTGVNPTTITSAPPSWVKQFKDSAQLQRNDKMVHLLADAESDGSLYIQDYSYFREAVGAAPDAQLRSSDGKRFGCAPVALFRLLADGKLHPLAIVIDYKGSMDKSVVIFNKRLSPSDPESSEAKDWPWRYAKTCIQSADWTRHEVSVHLVNTHFIEEVVIVAAHRSLSPKHIVYWLLEPHWLKTLSLNAAARSTLVPSVVVRLAGITDDQMYSFINDAYRRFNWTDKYVPNDLRARGFPEERLASDPRMHNYAYGRNMSVMWRVIRKFVSSVLATVYTTDAQVANDTAIAAWCQEMRSASGGQIASFPLIQTRDDLIDAVTMCIHIASPEHTAVNYLQDYYQSFVINKPPAFFRPLPTTLTDLAAYNEDDLVKALPINHAQDWLLAGHLPHLLSSTVNEDQNLPNYALSVYKAAKSNGQTALADIAATFFKDIADFGVVVKKNSDDMDDHSVPYLVLDPQVLAVSILI